MNRRNHAVNRRNSLVSASIVVVACIITVGCQGDPSPDSSGIASFLKPRPRLTDRLVVILDASASTAHKGNAAASAASLGRRRCAELREDLRTFLSESGGDAEVLVLLTGGSAGAGNPTPIFDGSLTPIGHGSRTHTAVVRQRAAIVESAVTRCEQRFTPADTTAIYRALQAAQQSLASRCTTDAACGKTRVRVHTDGIETVQKQIACSLRPDTRSCRKLAREMQRHSRKAKVAAATGTGLAPIAFAPASTEVSYCGLAQSTDSTAVDVAAVWRPLVIASAVRFDAVCRAADAPAQEIAGKSDQAASTLAEFARPPASAGAPKAR